VFLQVSDPVAQGYVTSLTHPGANITGFSSFEFSIGGKWIERLKEAAPKVTRVAVMSNPDTSPQVVEHFGLKVGKHVMEGTLCIRRRLTIKKSRAVKPGSRELG
jgi:ABC-type uncharacterized transport system substrate-binding protein